LSERITDMRGTIWAETNDSILRPLSVTHYAIQVSGLHHFQLIEKVTIRLFTVIPQRERTDTEIGQRWHNEAYSYSASGAQSLFPLLQGGSNSERISDMRDTIWAERLAIVFVEGTNLPAQARDNISSPQYALLNPGTRQSGARRVKIDIEYTEDSRLLPVHIEHDFTWILRVAIPTNAPISKGEHFNER